MTTAVQRRRGTATEHSSFTGLEGELSVNTTNESVHVHDGSTAGGFELMRADGSNSSVTLGDISGVTAGTGLSGGGTSGTVTLDIDSTVTTLDGTQTLTNKTLTSPTLNTPTIGTSFTIGGATITEAELEILDGATVTTTELNYVDGVTSSIQTQIDAKAPLASPTFTGTVTMDGLTVDTNTLYVDSTNNRVGIGTTSPTEKLHLNGTALMFGARMSSNNGSTYWDVKRDISTGHFHIADDSLGNVLTIRQDSGNVGIGTTSPDADVHISSAGNDAKIILESSANPRGNFIACEGADDLVLAADEDNLGASSAMKFRVDATERMRIDSSGNVGIGTTSPSKTLVVNENDSECVAIIKSSDTGTAGLFLGGQTDEIKGGIVFNNSDNSLQLRGYNNAERARIDSSGNLLVGTTQTDVGFWYNRFGCVIESGGQIHSAVSGDACAVFNRNTNDGEIVELRQGGSKEGSISVSGSTVSYNGFSGRHESSGISSSTEKGTVVSTIDELDTYISGVKQGQTRADHAKVKVSDIVGDSCVYGVVDDFNDEGKVNVISVGIGAVRVTGSCAKGDLLESNGDGTARVQPDDIVRNKTIGKVTIGNNDTNVKLVSCVLYCG